MRISQIIIDLDDKEQALWTTRVREGDQPDRRTIEEATWRLAKGFQAPVVVHVRAGVPKRFVDVFTSTQSDIQERQVPLRLVLALSAIVSGTASPEEWRLVATDPTLGGIDQAAEMLACLERQKAHPNESWTIADGWKMLLEDGDSGSR